MPAGTFQLIVSFVVAAIVYYLGTIIPDPIVNKLAAIVAAIIAVLALLNFLRGFIS